jgi:hypothetical protein
MSGVLSGIRVLDFGRYIAGPYCATLLAEFGADVIRIEKRSGGEDRFQAPLTVAQDGGLFMQMNRNKRGMTLDPMTPAGQDVVRRLVKTADVVVANLPPQTLAAMKLDYDSLAQVKPDIILTMVTAYGRGGPYSDRVGFDGIGQVMSGAAYMTSEADGERPYRFQAPWVDFGTALHCAYGTAMALMARQQTGRGQVVEGALLATALTIGNGLLIEQGVLGINRVPSGNRGQTAARGPVAVGPQVQGRHHARGACDGDLRTDGPLVRRANVGRSARHPRQGDDPGRPGAEAAAGAGRSARAGHGILPGRRLPGTAQASAAGAHAGVALRHARLDPPPRAYTRRTHRRDPGRAGLRRRRYCGSARAGRGVRRHARCRDQGSRFSGIIARSWPSRR